MTPEEKEALLADLRTKHGTLFVVDSDEAGLVVARRMNMLDFRSYRADKDDEDKKAMAEEILACRLLVYPDRASFDAMRDTLPGIVMAIAGQALTSSGVSVQVKKL